MANKNNHLEHNLLAEEGNLEEEEDIFYLSELGHIKDKARACKACPSWRETYEIGQGVELYHVVSVDKNPYVPGNTSLCRCFFMVGLKLPLS